VPERDIPMFVQMWRDGVLPLEALISQRVSLGGINTAMDELAAGNAVRQIIEFDS
jgi:alcohol dehydrogenase